MLTVVKVGGRLTGEGSGLDALVRAVMALPGRVVVVHGGGSEITEWQKRLDLPVLWSDGLRVTTEEGMRITAMVLSGWVNKRVVSAFLSAGEPAVGLSGEDDLIRAVRKQAGRLGEVGEVVAVNETPVRALLAAGILPVISPVSRGPAGVPLNVNADEAALAMAVALRADRLLLVSDVAGVVHEGVPVPVLTPAAAEELLEREVVTGGMGVKVRQALEAARAGVEVRIGDDDILRDSGAGTRVLAAEAPLTAVGGEG